MRKLIVLVSLLVSPLASAQVSTPPLRIYAGANASPDALKFKLRMTGAGVSCAPSGAFEVCTIGGGGGSGTVTNIATTGPITGGPITTTGTLACATCVVTGGSTMTGPFVLSGTQTGTYTLGGTPTIASPTITTAVTLPAAITEAANVVYTGGASLTNTVGFTNTQNVADGASSVAFKLANTTALTAAGAEILSMFDGGSKRWAVQPIPTGIRIIPAGSLNVYLELRTSDASLCTQVSGSPTCIRVNYNVGSAIEFDSANTISAVSTSTAFRAGANGSQSLGAPSVAWKGAIVGAAAASQPTCDSTTRGDMFPVFAALGASDTFQICMKAAADTYAWRTVFTAP